jgi:DNA polymerase III epsilon subunit-like protein
MKPLHKLLSKDTYISFDVETTGFIAGVNSVISLGAVAYVNGEEHSNFYGAMFEFEGAERDIDTMKGFWVKHMEEWKRIRRESEDPSIVMARFEEWLETLPQPLSLAANPSAFDSSLLWWYMHRYCSPGSINKYFKRHRALDMRSLITAMLALPYSESERYKLPNEWSGGLKITHNALEDAREQGVVLMHMLKAIVGEIEDAG